jgi:hypothetical protein
VNNKTRVFRERRRPALLSVFALRLLLAEELHR